VGARINASVGKYASNSTEDYEDFGAAVTGRWDIVTSTYVDGGLSVVKSHEERASRDNVGGVEPTEFVVLTGQAGFTRALGRVSLYVDTELKDYQFSDGRTASGVIDNSSRDRKEYSLTTRVAYELVPQYDIFVQGTLDQRRYDDTVTSNRDSDGWDASVGLDIDVSGKVKGDVSVGYVNRSYDAVGAADTGSLKVDSNILWNPTEITSVTGGVFASVQETTVANSSGYLSRGGSVGVDHELMTNVLLNTELSYQNDAFEGSGIDQIDDDILGASFGVNYLWNRNFNLGVSYGYTDRDSNTANGSYTDNRILTNVSFTY
jgi:hypothetical protein